MNEWISIKDKVPVRLSCVLGFMKDGCISIVCQCDWDDACDDWHYMPRNCIWNDNFRSGEKGASCNRYINIDQDIVL